MSATAAPEIKLRSVKSAMQPRLGFLGVGWIGRSRMEAIARSGIAEIAAIADAAPEAAQKAAEFAPCAAQCGSLDELLQFDLDGVVIATPSALHAGQAIAALKRGCSVFCQKPLARTAEETHRVIAAAKQANRLLGVDLSYRYMEGAAKIRELIRRGDLGDVFAADLVFHNAYGPDKGWFYDAKLSGGGCVIDLGIHLVDLALWCLDYPRVSSVSSRIFAGGKPLGAKHEVVEDFAVARLDLESGAAIQIGCSWRLHAGCDAIVSGAFYGNKGGAEFRNVNGSFFDFVAHRFSGTSRELLASPPDAWGGRAAVDWVRRLAAGAGYQPEVERIADVAGVLDRIYERY